MGTIAYSIVRRLALVYPKIGIAIHNLAIGTSYSYWFSGNSGAYAYPTPALASVQARSGTTHIFGARGIEYGKNGTQRQYCAQHYQFYLFHIGINVRAPILLFKDTVLPLYRHTAQSKQLK
jgi:hypothetical protein